MKKSSSSIMKGGFQLLAFILALGFTSLILILSKANPFQAYANIVEGSTGSIKAFSNSLVAWIPLLLATTGLLITYAAGLWNIGVEGQITIGAVCSTWLIRSLQDSNLTPALIIVLAILAGAIGGALWAALVGILKLYGGVNEIFGGLGMNFVATALTIWLVFSPWKRPGVASMSGTESFPTQLWLPQVEGLKLSLWSLGLGLVGLIVVFFILNGTYFGLKLKAVGKNGRAAFLMGIPTSKYVLSAFMICGIFAGLAGAVQTTGVYHRLVPLISAGNGYLGMMVAMLVNFQPLLAGLVSLFFAALNIGGIQLQIVMKLDSTLSGVIQGSLVLFFLLMEGIRRKFYSKNREGKHE